MTKYCPNCYVGVAPDDEQCENCGAQLTPELIEMKASFDTVNGFETKTPNRTSEDDAADAADSVLAPIIESNDCGEPEPSNAIFENPFENAVEGNTATEPIGMDKDDAGVFKEDPTPKAGYTPPQNNQGPKTSYTPPQGNQGPKVMGLGEWLLTVFLICIPIVNLVMLVYWSAANEIDPNKKNFARAQLIIMGISVVLSFIFFGSIVAMVLAASSYMYY